MIQASVQVQLWASRGSPAQTWVPWSSSDVTVSVSAVELSFEEPTCATNALISGDLYCARRKVCFILGDTQGEVLHGAACSAQCSCSAEMHGEISGCNREEYLHASTAAQPLISQCSCMLPCKGCFRLSSTWCVFEQLDGTWPRDRQAGNEEIACLILDLFFDYLF